MRTIRLVIGLVWRAFKERHLPDPRDQVATARQWLEQNIRGANDLTPTLIENAKAAGFAATELSADTFRQLRHSEPWGGRSSTSLWIVSKTIPDRIAFIVTDVKTYIAIDNQNKILAVLIQCNRIGV